MNYNKHYNKLIERAKNRLLECYTERHHIVPKCMGGNNENSNLVRLTAEEHYVAHQLLVKMYPGNHKLVYAAVRMTTGSKFNERSNNKKYGWLRRQHAKTHSIVMKGKPSWIKGKKHSEETKRKMSLAQQARVIPPEVGRKISKSKTGVKFTKEHCKALSAAHIGLVSNKKGKTHSEIYGAESKRIREELSNALKGKRQIQVACPHCNKVGGKPIMHRYHFNKCKQAIT